MPNDNLPTNIRDAAGYLVQHRESARDSRIEYMGVKTRVIYPKDRDVSKNSIYLNTGYVQLVDSDKESYYTRTIPETSSYLKLVNVLGFDTNFEEPLRVKIKQEDTGKILVGYVLDFVDKINLSSKIMPDIKDPNINLDVWRVGEIETKAIGDETYGGVAICYPVRYTAEDLEVAKESQADRDGTTERINQEVPTDSDDSTPTSEMEETPPKKKIKKNKKVNLGKDRRVIGIR